MTWVMKTKKTKKRNMIMMNEETQKNDVDQELQNFQNSISDVRTQVMAALPNSFFTANVKLYKNGALDSSIKITNPTLDGSHELLSSSFRSLLTANNFVAKYLKDNLEELANCEKMLLITPGKETPLEDINEFEKYIAEGKDTAEIEIVEHTDPTEVMELVKRELFEGVKRAYNSESLLTLITLFSNLSLFLEDDESGIKEEIIELLRSTNGTNLTSREVLEQFGFVESEEAPQEDDEPQEETMEQNVDTL